MPETDTLYDSAFFEDQVEGSVRSARAIVPLVLDLYPKARSVIDIGCGTGSWLRQYLDAGIDDILGVDGYLPDPSLLQVDQAQTLRRDLSLPLDLDRRFDIAQSMEVAEHLDPEAAEGFIDTLTGLSDLVVFGAAIPGQGGTAHINECWQSYWARLFAERGYARFDVIRPQVWNRSDVKWWYAQNTFVYVRESNDALMARMHAAATEVEDLPDVVHPACLGQFLGELAQTAEQLETARNDLGEARHDLDACRQEVGVLKRDLAEANAALEETAYLLDTYAQRLAAAEPSENGAHQVASGTTSLHNQRILLLYRLMAPSGVSRLAERASWPRDKEWPWSRHAQRHPLRVSEWRGLKRLERRAKRSGKRSLIASLFGVDPNSKLALKNGQRGDFA